MLQVYEDTSGLTVGDGVVRTGKVGCPSILGRAPAAQQQGSHPAQRPLHAHGRAPCQTDLLSTDLQPALHAGL